MAGYNPAQRKKAFQGAFRITAARRAWAKVSWGSVAFMKYDTPQEVVEAEVEEGVQPTRSLEPGPTVRLVISKNGRARATTLDLTMLTEADLRAAREVFELAFEAALPVCKQRDQEARNAYENGDDSFTRLYRPLPELVVREGTSREHDPSVWDRPADVPGGVRGHAPGQLRAGSDAVAELPPSRPGSSEPQDDGA